MRKWGVITGASRQIEEPQINLTPLIDVVFVILIMFIVIAPLLNIDKIQLAESGETKKESVGMTDGSGKIRISVFANNTLTLNDQPVTLQELAIRLKKIGATNPRARPQLFHDKNASFGTYQSVKNALEAAGFEEMDLLLKP